MKLIKTRQSGMPAGPQHEWRVADFNDIVRDDTLFELGRLGLAYTFDGRFRRLWPQTDIASARLNDLEVFYSWVAERDFGAAA